MQCATLHRSICLASYCFIVQQAKIQFSDRLLERFYDQQILKWVESVEAIAVSAEDAKILQIPEGSPVVLRTDVVYSTGGKNIACNQIIMTANYKITGLVYKKERL